MTREYTLLDRIRGLQRHYGRQYRWSEFRAHQKELEAMPGDAIDRAIVALKAEYEMLPAFEIFLKSCRDQAYGPLADRGQQILRLIGDYHTGLISFDEYEAKLNQIGLV